MQTIALIVAGLVLVAVFVLVGRWANRRVAMPVNGAFIFIICWTAFTFGHFLVAIFNPEVSPLVELGKHVAIFVVPVAAALGLDRTPA